MPTGYTAGIEKGMTFPEFVFGCARAMGALIMMRDDPSGAEIPDKFEPSSHNAEQLNSARIAMVKLGAMNDVELDAAARAEYDEAVSDRARGMAQSNALLEKYEAMLKQVNDWVPPSADHVNFKEFMIEQITSSIKFDCVADYYAERIPVLRSGQEWLKDQVEKIQRRIEFHREAHAKEVERTNSRNKWIADLRNSLKSIVSAG